jgi:hypothetical protein
MVMNSLFMAVDDRSSVNMVGVFRIMLVERTRFPFVSRRLRLPPVFQMSMVLLEGSRMADEAVHENARHRQLLLSR